MNDVKPLIPDAALDRLWRKARSFNDFTPQPVTDADFGAAVTIWRSGARPLRSGRVVFVRSVEAKERLARLCVAAEPEERRFRAPVVAILAYDMRFFEHLPRLLHNPQARSWYETTPEAIRTTALRNARLQGAYLMLAAARSGSTAGDVGLQE